MEVIAKRHWAATEIARWARGSADRRLALNKLETKLTEAHAKLDRERYYWDG